MSERHGVAWWNELMTRDLPAALNYYQSLCGWSFETMPMPEGGDYHIGMKDGKPMAGFMDMAHMADLNEAPPHWITYFAVDDVDAAIAATTEAGGQVIREIYEVPNTGRIAIVEDPSGVTVGLITPAPMESG
ncbi:MAG: VOC family protein [Litoreibacter sp.]|nr:VOC family protein [Litoreibacter sp.]